MPITAGAIRKLRADRRKSTINLRVKRVLKQAVSGMRKKPSEKNLKLVFTAADRAVKKKAIHANKGDRLKSRMSRLVNKRRSS